MEAAYADILPDNPAMAAESQLTVQSNLPPDAQDTYFESREPAELVFCIILTAAYAGLAKFCWQPLEASHQWVSFTSVEVLFSVMALLALVLGLRPYLSPSTLQISNHGVKYRGPYWPQRKTVNWQQIFRLYLSPELIVVLYHPSHKPTAVRFLFIQSSYLADKEGIVSSFARYALVPPTYLKNPDWYIKGILLTGYMSVVCWILYMLRG